MKLTETIHGMILWSLVPISLIITCLMPSCDECRAGDKSPGIAAYEQEIRSAPEYQLIRVYEDGKQVEKQYQYEWKKNKWKRVKVKGGVWTKHDDKKPKKPKKDVISRIFKALSEWGMAFAGEDEIMTVLTHPDREEIVTIVILPGYSAHYTKAVTIQVVDLEDGSTTCRVTHEKNYIGNKNQGYGSWTEYTEVQE